MIPWKIITSPVQALNSPHQALFRVVWNHIFGTLQRCSIWGEWGYRWFKCRYYHHPVSRTWIWTLNPSHGRFLEGTWTTPVFKQTNIAQPLLWLQKWDADDFSSDLGWFPVSATKHSWIVRWMYENSMFPKERNLFGKIIMASLWDHWNDDCSSKM